MDPNRILNRLILSTRFTILWGATQLLCTVTCIFHPRTIRKLLNIESWHLDCSPECRSKSTPCESTKFELDPYAFITSSYGLTDGGQVCSNSREDIDACAKNERPDGMKALPDVMAIYESDLNRGFDLESVLVQNGMKIVGRCRHGIKGVQISRPNLGNKKQVSRGGVFSEAQIPSLEVEFDFMIIFSSLELPSLQNQSLI
eukprot:266339_1